jgi:hypothetical protein
VIDPVTARLTELAEHLVDAYGSQAVDLLENWFERRRQELEDEELTPSLRDKLADEADIRLGEILSGSDPMRGLALDFLVDDGGPDPRSVAQRWVRANIKENYIKPVEPEPEPVTLPDGTIVDEEVGAEILGMLEAWAPSKMMKDRGGLYVDRKWVSEAAAQQILENESNSVVRKYPAAESIPESDRGMHRPLDHPLIRDDDE